MKVCHYLIKYANSREAAYRHAGCITAARAAAISKIKRVASYYSARPIATQMRALQQLETEITTILPGEGSRYGKLRTQVLRLLSESKAAVPSS